MQKNDVIYLKMSCIPALENTEVLTAGNKYDQFVFKSFFCL